MPTPIGERYDYHFEWDENKNRQNIKKHGLDFADAEKMLRGVVLVRPDAREDYGETAGLESVKFADVSRLLRLLTVVQRQFASFR